MVRHRNEDAALQLVGTASGTPSLRHVAIDNNSLLPDGISPLETLDILEFLSIDRLGVDANYSSLNLDHLQGLDRLDYLSAAGNALNRPGLVDDSFMGGSVTVGTGLANSVFRDVVVQPDGKIVLVGNASSNAFIARILADGKLDPGFGDGGIVNFPVREGLSEANPIGNTQIFAVALQDDGQILVTGYSNQGNGPDRDFLLLRLNENGQLDDSFGRNGKVVTDFAMRNDQAYGLAIQSDNRIVVVGGVNELGVEQFGIARYMPDGRIDTSFGTEGMVTKKIGEAGDIGSEVAIQPDGKIVVGGKSHNGTDWDFSIARFDSQGNLDDENFGQGGMKIGIDNFSPGVDDQGNALFLQPDGRILVAGVAGGRYAVARYHAGGELDTTFGDAGLTRVDLTQGSDVANTLELMEDGSILVGGSRGIDESVVVVKLTADGVLDTSFGFDGMAVTPVNAPKSGVTVGIALGAEGQIFATGGTTVEGLIQPAVTRLTSDYR